MNVLLMDLIVNCNLVIFGVEAKPDAVEPHAFKVLRNGDFKWESNLKLIYCEARGNIKYKVVTLWNSFKLNSENLPKLV